MTRIALVSEGYFSTLRVDVATGRLLTDDDDCHPVAVISEGYWSRWFGRSSGIVGQTFSLNGIVYTIVGATATGFSGDWIGQPVDL